MPITRAVGPVASTLLALLLAGGAAAQGATTPQIEAGSRIAGTWCANCHLTGTAARPRGNDAAPTFNAIAARPSTTMDSLAARISGRHPRMPDLNLSQAEIAAVSAYILSLRKTP